MLRGFLTFFSLLPLVHCTRQSSYSYAQILAESSSVPRVIYDALREAGALVQTKLETLQEANRLAEQRQADSSAKIDEKMQAMKAMQTKTDQVAAKAQATRELMLQVDAAAAKHSKAGDDHKKSIAAFGTASEALEDMAKKVTSAEQKLREIFGDYKRELGDLQSQWDKMSQEKDQAEAEMSKLKTQAMSAGKFKTGVQEEQAKVERDMQLAQQELQGIHRALETAVSAATVAEAQEAVAVNEAREANGRVEVAKKTREYLMKIRRAVQAYYDSIDELESAVDGKANVQLKDVPEAKMVLKKYNLMLSAFGDLHAYDAEVYQKVTAAKEEVKNNAFAQLRFICDMLGIPTSEEGHCLAGLWTTFGMSKLPFPDEAPEEAPASAPEAPASAVPPEEEPEEDDDIDLETPQELEEDEDDDIDMAPPKDVLTRRKTADEPLTDLPLPAPKRFKRSAPEPEEPPLPEVPKVSPAKNRKRKRVDDEPLTDLPLPPPKRFKRSAPEPEEPPLPEVPKVSPAKNRKRKWSEPEYDPLAHQRVDDEPLTDLPLPAPKRFKRSAPEPEEPPLPEVPKVSAKNLKRKRVTDEPLTDLPLPAPKRFKRSAPEPEEPLPEVPKVSPAKNRKRKWSEPEYDPLAHQRADDEPLTDLPLPAPKRFKRSAPEPEEPPLPEVPKSMEMPAPTSKLPALECGGAGVHWASCSKRDGCRYVKKADVSRCGVSQHGCYDESRLPSECQLSLAPAPPSGCGGGAVHFASCYKKSGCRYVKKEDVTLCGVSLYGCYAVKELPSVCQPKVRGVRVRLS